MGSNVKSSKSVIKRPLSRGTSKSEKSAHKEAREGRNTTLPARTNAAYKEPSGSVDMLKLTKSQREYTLSGTGGDKSSPKLGKSQHPNKSKNDVRP